MLWKSGDLMRGSIEFAALYLKCRGEDPKRLVRRDETKRQYKTALRHISRGFNVKAQ
ncbi:hypothetical protein PN472_01810 [Microcystis aeruginosa CS-1036]|uniref:hypothetical protein n=1 Tax=Microcystis aeruginosa TaxID=1126 RepID=UPI00232BF3D7|nr:hypothetical protein [Microcystis aeruginosa]MDB9541906.1 hypothetical protein [Microcystis aeruginosa CS-1036]